MLGFIQLKDKKTKEVEKILKEDLFIIGNIRPLVDQDLLSYDDFDRIYRIAQKHIRLRWNIVYNELILKRL
jgi:hypothetical protein